MAPFVWSEEDESILFRSLIQSRPLGLNKPYSMVYLFRVLNHYPSADVRISMENLRDKLQECYDMDALHEETCKLQAEDEEERKILESVDSDRRVSAQVAQTASAKTWREYGFEIETRATEEPDSIELGSSLVKEEVESNEAGTQPESVSQVGDSEAGDPVEGESQQPVRKKRGRVPNPKSLSAKKATTKELKKDKEDRDVSFRPETEELEDRSEVGSVKGSETSSVNKRKVGRPPSRKSTRRKA